MLQSVFLIFRSHCILVLTEEARRITLETCQRMTQAEDRSKREASQRAALEKRLAIKDELLGLLKVSNATIKEDIERMDAMLQASAAEVKRYKSYIKKQAKQLDACNQTCAELSRELQRYRKCECVLTKDSETY